MNKVSVLVDYKSGIRKTFQYLVEDGSDLYRQFKKNHNLKLIESASVIYMSYAQDGLIGEFENLIMNPKPNKI